MERTKIRCRPHNLQPGARSPAFGAWPRRLGAGPGSGAEPARGPGRRTHTLLRSCGLHQASGGDPGECPHVRAARRAGPLPSGALRLRRWAPLVSATRAEPGLALCTPSCAETAFSASIPCALHPRCIPPRVRWLCSAQAGPASPSLSGDSQGQPCPSPVLHSPPPGAVFPEPARPRQRQLRCAGRAVRGSAGQCGAVQGSGQCGACGDTALRAAWGAARPAGVEVLLGPLRGPLGNCVCFPPASEKRLPVRSGTFKWAVSYLCLGAGDPAASEADSSFTVLPRGSEHFPLYLVSLPGARGPQRRGGCRVWKGPEARW